MKKWGLVLIVVTISLGMSTASSQTVLQWWDYYTDGANNDAMQDLVARYEAAHPDVDIQRTTIGFGDLKARIIQAAATGTMPDIVIVDNPDHQAMAAQGALADLTDYIAAWDANGQYFDGPWSSTVFGGRNYGVPYGSNATTLYYNEDVLAEAGLEPPLTWDELRAAAQALTTDDRSGFCLSLINTEEGTFTYLPFLWGNGGDIPDIGGAGNIEALSLLNAMMNDDGSISRAALNWGQGEVNNQFMAGQCAMMINGPWQIPGLTNADLDFTWNVSDWPNNGTPTSILGGENFAAGAGGNTDAAWEVISWVTSPENLLPTLQLSGYIANRADLASDDAFTSDPVVATFADQVAVAKARAYGENYPQISEEIMNMVQSVLIGARSPEEAAEAAAGVIVPLLP
ncbi:MAG: sugar ABC transporter substrate-binding protein [Deinococcota bacterium]